MAMLIECSNIQKTFQGIPILKDVTFKVEETDKIAIIGVNGAGKTTILRILNDEESYDSGNVFKNKNLTIGYLSQQHHLDLEKTIYETGLDALQHITSIEKRLRTLEIEMATNHSTDILNSYDDLMATFQTLGGFSYPSKLTGVLKGLGFLEEEFSYPVSILSGGQKTRLALAKLLLLEPTLLLLDEPTNHLDSTAIHFLETYLKGYPHAIITVSHDRYFIDQVSNKIIEIENGKSKIYQCKYQEYSKLKQQQRSIDLKHYMNQQKEIKRIQDSIDTLKSYNREKSIKRAESKEKQLDKIVKIEQPEQLPDSISMQFKPLQSSGFNVLKMEDVEVAFEEPLFSNISIDIKKQERVALVGDNGIGKTTLFKTILGLQPIVTGTISFGSKVDLAYYDQEHRSLSLHKTVFKEIGDLYPRLNNTQIRSTLAMFNFKGEDVFKEINTLSGGERGRVVLTTILLKQANFLLLDEPTNHLDISSKEVLEEALSSFEGTIFFISHDRYFINKIATKIIELTPNNAIVYESNYETYLEHKYQPTITKEKNTSYEVMKKQQADVRKQKNQIKKIEQDISKVETDIRILNTQLQSDEIVNDYQKYNALQEEIQVLEKHLEVLFEQWEALEQ
jgi:ATP-binding cassette subfamily F protein 3